MDLIVQCPGLICWFLYLMLSYFYDPRMFVYRWSSNFGEKFVFIDLYLIFPTNFRIIFLPYTNTVILLEPYCGTITETGLPVLLGSKSQDFCLLGVRKFAFNFCHSWFIVTLTILGGQWPRRPWKTPYGDRPKKTLIPSWNVVSA